MDKRSSEDVTDARRTYRMTKRAEQASATRSRILEVASDTLRTGEFHHLSLEELARRAGTTRVTVYRAFGSKAAVLQAITWEVLARVRLDRLDAAHALPDAADAVRSVLYENCRMFTDLGDLLPITLELARRDPDTAAIIDSTYHGRRHQAMERLARRVVGEGHAAPGWTSKQIVDALLVLTSYETFETLTIRRGRSVRNAARALYELAGAFLR